MNWWDDNALQQRPDLAARTPLRDGLIVAGALFALVVVGIVARVFFFPIVLP